MAFPRVEMLELVKTAHATQFRNNGRVPYWMHLAGVAQILDWAIFRGAEIRDESLHDDLYVAALGHDLYEDTEVKRAEIVRRFGPRVDAWIQAMTNDGDDKDRKAYLGRLASGPEEARLIKLADLIENMASCAYAIPDMGVEWMRTFFVPVAIETSAMLRGASFPRYPRTADALRGQMEYHLRRLQSNLAMFLSLVPAQSTAPGGPAPEITKEAWDSALAKTREEERERAEKFGGGRPFPIPTPKDD